MGRAITTTAATLIVACVATGIATELTAASALAISAGLASASELAPMLNASGRRQSQAAETKT